MYKLIEELKDNNQDFEFYPTSKEMVKPIYDNFLTHNSRSSILDIGCGTCNFKKWLKEFDKENCEGDKFDKLGNFNYYVIEKSKILIDRLEKNVIVLGTDFNSTLLIDKKVDIIFCNPPYSEYVNWVNRIVSESNSQYIYLIIPERWKENKSILNTIEEAKVEFEILGSFDFLHGIRKARAKVDVIFVDKSIKQNRYYNTKTPDINETAFSKWFDETFKMRDKKNIYESELEKEHRSTIKNQLVSSESKAKMLVDLYNNEQKILFEHFKAICSLDVDILETIGIKKESVKEALKQKVKSLKILYWQIVFDEMEEITSRLTSKTRKNMLEKFKSLLTVDFTIENIYPLIIWVIKNANSYYNEQLIDFFKELSSPESVKMYKSNKKVFKLDKWRHNSWDNDQEVSHYTLDYRFVCRYIFRTSGTYNNELDNWDNQHMVNDICVIANNLGFKISFRDYPKEFGKKYNIHYNNKGKDEVLIEYRIYKNRNTHIKLNLEFAKALNVEVSRLLGWIRCKEDIKKEFCEEMAEGAEKYFKINNYIPIDTKNIKMLECKSDK